VAAAAGLAHRSVLAHRALLRHQPDHHAGHVRCLNQSVVLVQTLPSPVYSRFSSFAPSRPLSSDFSWWLRASTYDLFADIALNLVVSAMLSCLLNPCALFVVCAGEQQRRPRGEQHLPLLVHNQRADQRRGQCACSHSMHAWSASLLLVLLNIVGVLVCVGAHNCSCAFACALTLNASVWSG
jgi:hypothetical protein